MSNRNTETERKEIQRGKKKSGFISLPGKEGTWGASASESCDPLPEGSEKLYSNGLKRA